MAWITYKEGTARHFIGQLIVVCCSETLEKRRKQMRLQYPDNNADEMRLKRHITLINISKKRSPI